MIKIHYSPRSRSFSALWAMEETGEPYERVLTDISTGAQKDPAYLAINPMGKVPGLQDGGSGMGETAAIVAYIAEKFRMRSLRRRPATRVVRATSTGCSSTAIWKLQ